MDQREKLRELVLSRGLLNHPDQSARPVWVYPQFDKLSQAWIKALPTPTTYLSSPVFREAMADHLCLPASCCQGKVGLPVGREGAFVDPFGDSIICAKLPFDTWRHRHDEAKKTLVERAHHAMVEAEAEVFGLFRDQVPAVAWEREGSLGM